mgnify:CR=1 FL=1
MNKYRAKKTEVDGILFDSRKEAARYRVLRDDPNIKDLELQPKFDLLVTNLETGEKKKVGFYKADFRYTLNGEVIIEDVKGVKTSVYNLKKRIIKGIYNIDIKET